MGPALGEVFLHCAQGWGRARLPMGLRLGVGCTVEGAGRLGRGQGMGGEASSADREVPVSPSSRGKPGDACPPPVVPAELT